MDPSWTMVPSWTQGPSWTDILQAIGSIGGLAIALLGFIVVIIQIRQVNKSIESETHSKLYTMD